MLIIDRYLLRQFFQTFLICYLSLMGLYVVFDAFTNLEEFLRCGAKSGGVVGLIVSFYSYQSVAFFDRTSGMLALISAMFTVAWIQRHNEMTALRAAGISRIRVVRPIIVAAVAIALLAAANREVLIPQLRRQLSRKPQDLIGDVGQELLPRLDNQTEILLRGNATFADRQRIDQPNFLMPRELSDYGSQLAAAQAFYRPPEGNRPGGYLLDEVREPKDLASRPSLRLDGKPVLITPCDASDWLQPNQCFVASDINFEQLAGGQHFRQFASAAELIAGLRNPSMDFGADVRVAVHSRLVQPLLDVTLLLLGLPLVVTRHSRNVFLAIGLCSVVAGVFLLTVIGAQYLGTIYLYPTLAAWAPLMIFVPVAVGLAEGMWE
jgi:lipopolysaccharide export system permease protein